MAAFAAALALGAAGALAAREGIVQLVARRKGRSSSRESTQAGANASVSVTTAAVKPWQPARDVGQPHPDWTPGTPQPCPLPGASEYQTIDVATTPPGDVYPLVIAAVVPRPVAFISSVDAHGSVNLSPYSFFNAMGFDPPTVAIGLCHSKARPEGKKDTLHNIEDTGEFVVNIMSEWFVEAANHCCGDYPRGVDEMRLAGLTPLASTKVKPPRVAESAVHMECKLRTIHHVTGRSGDVSTSIVIGEVLAFHVSQAVAARSPSGRPTVDLVRLAPVARCGGVTYARSAELYDLPRPDGQGRYPQREAAAAAAAQQQQLKAGPVANGEKARHAAAS
ncbi:hypothetical protein HYH03_004102 [Edaphochlamys debaryana]|uniref:Flavin reductase like domain-containing protein n=1 Tax=Edaphochlamys debaryana TaxID=47281 RepID=A0A836C3I5_9CHLO|nr:hypothetical protein HYH03_004102 [Edaphochlamys debaryana]|eukprot:KAG2497832.1 hypothetical protein HYH03_004102 [Edaphochlamys debaryana]